MEWVEEKRMFATAILWKKVFWTDACMTVVKLKGRK